MHTHQRFSDNSGTSLLELTIALFISSIVVIGALQLYRFTIRSATREQDKAVLQSDIITFSNIIEKDIRMAGCGLPGNGLKTTGSDGLTLFTNESGKETTLAEILQPAHTQAIVADAAGFELRGGICIASAGVDTVYRSITRIGICSGGPDTIHFDEAVNTALPFLVAPTPTRVFPTLCTRYAVSGTSPDRTIARARNSQTIPIGGKLDSMYIVPKDAAGAPVGGAIKNASVLTVVMGGYIGSGGNRVFIADSTEVNIRNRK